jgi:hypothetical protein
MTKAAMCTTCGQIVGPRPKAADWSVWTWCAPPCSHTAVRWRDGAKGLLEVTSLHGPEGVVVIGLHNGFIAGLSRVTSAADWRELHDDVTHAPGYLFDSSKRDCWAVLVRPGQSADVFFMPYGAAWAEKRLAEAEEAGLIPPKPGSPAALTLAENLSIGPENQAEPTET